MITASLCSIPDREKQLRATLESLDPQVDRVRLFLNGYREIPRWLGSMGYAIRADPEGALGDARKFHWSDSVSGYHLVCDDDIKYPADYAARMVAAIEEHARRCVVGVHGAILNEQIKTYRRSRRTHHFRSALDDYTPCHVLGTGTVAYHADTIEVRPGDFPAHGMADLYFAALAQDQGVPMIAVPRLAGWLEAQPTRGSAIFDDEIIGSRSTAFVKGRQWRLLPIP